MRECKQQPDAKAPRARSETSARDSGRALGAIKLAIELGPLLVFFGVNAAAGIYAATAVFMVATLISLAVAWLALPQAADHAARQRRRRARVRHAHALSPRRDLHQAQADPRLSRSSPRCSGAGLLLRSRCSSCCSARCSISPRKAGGSSPCAGSLFFIAMAVVNEIVWRNFSTDAWVSFKAFGFLPLTFLFALAQMPLMQRYALPPARGLSRFQRPDLRRNFLTAYCVVPGSCARRFCVPI